MDADIRRTAENKIADVTFNRSKSDNLTDFQWQCVTEAIEYQCEYYEKYGTDTDGINSLSVEDFSISYTVGSAAQSGLDSRALNVLKQSGLMCGRLKK
jgi:hypothetical protein